MASWPKCLQTVGLPCHRAAYKITPWGCVWHGSATPHCAIPRPAGVILYDCVRNRVPLWSRTLDPASLDHRPLPAAAHNFGRGEALPHRGEAFRLHSLADIPCRHGGYACTNSARYGRASSSGISVALFVAALTSLRQPSPQRAQSHRWRWLALRQSPSHRHHPLRHPKASPSHIGEAFPLVRTPLGRASPRFRV